MGMPKPRLHARILYWTLGIATLLGSTGFLFLQPRLSVSASEPLHPSDPFTAAFTITNTNIVPLHDVCASMGMIEFESIPLPFDERRRPPIDASHIGSITLPEWNHHRLDIDEKFTIYGNAIAPAPGAAAAGGDIAIIVKYRPWILPLENQKVFRFVTHSHGDGTFSWFSFPVK